MDRPVALMGKWVHLRLGMDNLEKVALRAHYSPAALIVVRRQPARVSELLE